MSHTQPTQSTAVLHDGNFLPSHGSSSVIYTQYTAEKLVEDTYFLVTDVFTMIITMADIIVEVRTNIFGDSLMVIRQELSPAVTGEIWYHCGQDSPLATK